MIVTLIVAFTQSRLGRCFCRRRIGLRRLSIRSPSVVTVSVHPRRCSRADFCAQIDGTVTFAGDDDVLELLSRNVAANAPKGVARVEKLVWGGDDPLAAIGLDTPPDLLLASDVVYGNDPVKWRQLVKTMRDLSGPRTLVVVGNVQRYPVHHPMAETRFSRRRRRRISSERGATTGLHPDFRRTGEEAAWCTCFVGDPNRSSAREGNPRGTRRRLASARGSARGRRRNPARGREEEEEEEEIGGKRRGGE